MNTDLSFITNDKNHNLKDRFEVLIKDTSYFDCLVGYFYSSGFYSIYPALEHTKNIRIIIGINTDRKTYDLLKTGTYTKQQKINFSHAETKKEIDNLIQQEMQASDDNKSVEDGINKFITWIKNGKLQIKAYPSQNIHAKLYLMTFKEDDRDIGRVITGSSNFTKSGLVDNLEFNVELKNRSDYDFAKNKFEELWRNSVDISEKYVQTIQQKTWLSQDITPYHLYLKFLYEYFKDELNQTGEMIIRYLPQEFKKLEYQEQAVLNAKKILLEYGGVFISDVVGLGKTYVSAMLAAQLSGRTLVLAPPVLLEKSNPGSWLNVFSDFKVHADFESIGKLDNLISRGTHKYSNIIIDEAHRFRNEVTETYEKLAKICRGKRVILVTATPYNNSPKDILSLLKLFQKSKNSTIPNLKNLEEFFKRLEKNVKKLDRKKDYYKYIKMLKANAALIRDRVLKYLMVRRTRSEIEKYFSDDIQKQGLKFPKITKPKPLFYKLNNQEENIFDKTIDLITNKFKYSRYKPMLYYNGPVAQPKKLAQKNMGKFMKILLIKRLESSFFAFKKSIDRFLHSYEMFLDEYNKGNVYVSKKHINKIFELIENGDDETIAKLIDDEKAERYNSSDFKESFKKDLEKDYYILKDIKDMWNTINRDPKLFKLNQELIQNTLLRNNHLIIFTESKETAEYLYNSINDNNKVLLFTGDSNESLREKVINNFDAKAIKKKDDFRILICTEVLAEGVNLHRANVVINYDIPWNPTRMMQRVGRINRVDTPFETIHTFNFFPTTQTNNLLKLKEAAIGKINAFLTLLGGDAELLTEGEPVDSHELFNRLVSKKTIEGEEFENESELKYLKVIQKIRKENPDIFERIKKLPKKARTAKIHSEFDNKLITYFRKGKIQKFFIAKNNDIAEELDFMTAAQIIESKIGDIKQEIPLNQFYECLKSNKDAFLISTTEEINKPKQGRGRDSTVGISAIVKATLHNRSKLTDEQELYLKEVLKNLNEGGLPKQTAKKTFQALNNLGDAIINPFKVITVLQMHIPDELLRQHYAEKGNSKSAFREVILSLFLAGD